MDALVRRGNLREELLFKPCPVMFMCAFVGHPVTCGMARVSLLGPVAGDPQPTLTLGGAPLEPGEAGVLTSQPQIDTCTCAYMSCACIARDTQLSISRPFQPQFLLNSPVHSLPTRSGNRTRTSWSTVGRTALDLDSDLDSDHLDSAVVETDQELLQPA